MTKTRTPAAVRTAEGRKDGEPNSKRPDIAVELTEHQLKRVSGGVPDLDANGHA